MAGITGRPFLGSSMAEPVVPRGTFGVGSSECSRYVEKSLIIRPVRRLFRLSEFLLGGDAAGNGALGWVRASPMCGFSRSRGGREPQSRG